MGIHISHPKFGYYCFRMRLLPFLINQEMEGVYRILGGSIPQTTHDARHAINVRASCPSKPHAVVAKMRGNDIISRQTPNIYDVSLLIITSEHNTSSRLYV